MINISEIERWGVLWIWLKALGGNGKKSCKSGREKTSLCTSVNTKVVFEGKVTDKDKDCITLSFPPFGGLSIIFVWPVQVHGEQSFWLVCGLGLLRWVAMFFFLWQIGSISWRFGSVWRLGISLSKGNPHKSILLGVAGKVCGLRLVTDTRGKGKDGPEKVSCPPHVLDVFFLHVTKAYS